MCLVKQWVCLDKFGVAYCLNNGNFGMAFRDKTHLYMYCESELPSNQLVEMVSYIPKDSSAQICFRKGEAFADFLKKKVKIFEKSIKQLKYQLKVNLGLNSQMLKAQTKENLSDLQNYINFSRCSETILCDHFISTSKSMVLFKIENYKTKFGRQSLHSQEDSETINEESPRNMFELKPN